MNRQALISEIENYQSKYPEEMIYRGRFLDLLSYDDCFERSLLFGHITASAWVLNPSKDAVVLMHHKKLDRWLQPGGHTDGDEDVVRVARKELEEETGLRNVLLLHDGIFDLDIHPIPARKEVPAHEHYDVRFVFVTLTPDELTKNEESNQLAWIPLTDISSYVANEISIMRMVEKSALLYI
ncbi:NUDIX hydrolase [Reichenbachiella agarivorans]|uniref:NUDIX hydrolase n=1 Tax=Reichenbachiella agarivorans TaxID=2979464 RepID=A0ABY6CPT2_9BACT|nr:NUDIX hydrolase [Reichenbachiella agarivorans]UXP32511.1 NUDIX hydrolase [Reichenbachiella agarivorans]